jgi:hypothetical protein
MSARTVVAGNFFLVMMCRCLAGNASYYSMVAALNQQRSVDKQISTWGFNRWRSFDHISEYHRLFPASRLLLLDKLGLTVMIAGFISIGLCFMLR